MLGKIQKVNKMLKGGKSLVGLLRSCTWGRWTDDSCSLSLSMGGSRRKSCLVCSPESNWTQEGTFLWGPCAEMGLLCLNGASQALTQVFSSIRFLKTRSSLTWRPTRILFVNAPSGKAAWTRGRVVLLRMPPSGPIWLLSCLMRETTAKYWGKSLVTILQIRFFSSSSTLSSSRKGDGAQDSPPHHHSDISHHHHQRTTPSLLSASKLSELTLKRADFRFASTSPVSVFKLGY